MASWKKNKLVGLVAGIIIIIAIALIAKTILSGQNSKVPSVEEQIKGI
ncbi:MAG: hypothetical protein ABH872_02655 [Candidatus Omnitrophota bacterium]